MSIKINVTLPDGRRGPIEIIGNKSDYPTEELIQWIQWGLRSAPVPNHPELLKSLGSRGRVYYGLMLARDGSEPLTPLKILFDRYAGQKQENVLVQNLAGWSGHACRIKLRRPEIAVGTMDFMAATGAVSADSEFKARMSRSFSQDMAIDIVGFLVLNSYRGDRRWGTLFTKAIPTPGDGLHVLAKRSAMQADEFHHLARVQLHAKLKLDFGDYGKEIATFVAVRKRVLRYMTKRATELGDQQLVRHLTTLESQVNALLTVEGPLTSLTHRVRQHIETNHPDGSADV